MSELAVIAEPGEMTPEVLEAGSPSSGITVAEIAAADDGAAAIALADLLVEEVSIDGMCGVY
jgi:mycofactocin precursor